ncbi:hypothetical protein OH492_10840 [Vibrio chagasii]|nr:hypothetical protein [Vibrio chagasii]
MNLSDSRCTLRLPETAATVASAPAISNTLAEIGWLLPYKKTPLTPQL